MVVVNSKNLKKQCGEMFLAFLNNRGSFVAVDTEFPGTLPQSGSPIPYTVMSAQEKYDVMRNNVNKLKLIQLGISVSNGRGKPRTWEFNFKDFDFEKDPCDKSSIELLKSHGIDFVKNKEVGIAEKDFANEFLSNDFRSMNLAWVFFHCTYDLGYLIKVLTQKPLPESVDVFMGLVRSYLGRSVFDVKEMVKAKPFEWSGAGLNKVAQNLGVERVGKSHQAGSDSRLTLDCLLNMLNRGLMLTDWSYQLYGFDKPTQPKKKEFPVRDYGGYTPYHPHAHPHPFMQVHGYPHQFLCYDHPQQRNVVVSDPHHQFVYQYHQYAGTA